MAHRAHRSRTSLLVGVAHERLPRSRPRSTIVRAGLDDGSEIARFVAAPMIGGLILNGRSRPRPTTSIGVPSESSPQPSPPAGVLLLLRGRRVDGLLLIAAIVWQRYPLYSLAGAYTTTGAVVEDDGRRITAVAALTAREQWSGRS